MDEILQSIRKERHQRMPRFSLMRILLPIQTVVTRVLIRTPINSRQLTVLWFTITLGAYGVMLLGVPWAFVVGSLMVYVAMILDGSDGEVGRYQARNMTPEEDLITHINGMYLDRLCHLLTSPFWPLAIAVGLYQMVGEPVVFAAGAALAMFQIFRRGKQLLDAYLVVLFRDRAAKMVKERGLDSLVSPPAESESFLARVSNRVEHLIRNGKRFNMLILLSAAVDWVLIATEQLETGLVLYTVFLACGIVSLMLLLRTNCRDLWRKNLVMDVCRAGEEPESGAE